MARAVAGNGGEGAPSSSSGHHCGSWTTTTATTVTEAPLSAAAEDPAAAAAPSPPPPILDARGERFSLSALPPRCRGRVVVFLRHGASTWNEEGRIQV